MPQSLGVGRLGLSAALKAGRLDRGRLTGRDVGRRSDVGPPQERHWKETEFKVSNQNLYLVATRASVARAVHCPAYADVQLSGHQTPLPLRWL
ncbi:hypothetical protein [Streptomyces acidicola]|uniref:hypothetical protein n=1 Tax=Streptomyces acidicola TaxID=2596892 RepID=UPI0018832573|nr:hypothetical protein [Streptomyces acidicola]